MRQVTGRAESESGTAVQYDTFIVGMSRAGTTWLARTLNRHPDIAVFGESAYWGRKHLSPAGGSYSKEDYREIVRRYRGRMTATDVAAEQGGAAGVLRAVAERAASTGVALTPAQVYRRVCERLGDLEAAQVVAEKTPHHVHWLDRIEESLPNARFVICVRGPGGFLLSYKHQGDRKPPPVRATFRNLYHPIVTAFVARQYLRTIRVALDARPDRTLLVRLEDVKDDPEAMLNDVQAFLGVPPKSGLDRGPENSSFPESRDRPDLDAAELFWLDLVAGTAGEELGYPRPSPGAFRPGWLAPLVTLPIALVRVLRVVRDATPRSVGEYLRGWIVRGGSR